jgi:hypothetical protein
MKTMSGFALDHMYHPTKYSNKNTKTRGMDLYYKGPIQIMLSLLRKLSPIEMSFPPSTLDCAPRKLSHDKPTIQI